MIGVLKHLSKALVIMLTVAFAASAIIGTPSLALDLDKYDPEHSNGSGMGDWWINHPNQSAKAGSAVEHPDWVLDALKEKPVLIMDHTTDCSSCKIQEKNIEEVTPDFDKDIAYYDLLADGKDKRAFEILNAYSPTGKEQFVPTTVFITLIKDTDGKVKVAWHSEIDDMTKEQLNEYLKDAVYYYRQNAKNWDK